MGFDAKAFATRLSIALAADERRDGEIAKAVGVDGSQLSRWKTGQAVPTAQYIVPLVTTLGVSAHWLLTGKGPQGPSGEEDALRLQLIEEIAARKVGVVDLVPLLKTMRSPS